MNRFERRSKKNEWETLFTFKDLSVRENMKQQFTLNLGWLTHSVGVSGGQYCVKILSFTNLKLNIGTSLRK